MSLEYMGDRWGLIDHQIQIQFFSFFSLDKKTEAERKPVGRSRCPSRLLAERTLRSQTGPGQGLMVLTLPVKTDVSKLASG